MERSYRTWQGRLPQELRIRKIQAVEAANRRQLMWVHLAGGLGRHEKVAGPVAVQRTENRLRFDHLPHHRHQRARACFLHQLGIVDLAGGIVQNGDQIVVPPVPEPGVLAGIDMQQHPGKGRRGRRRRCFPRRFCVAINPAPCNASFPHV